MSSTVIRAALRVVAIAIAIAALIDPVFSIERPRSPLIALIDMTNGPTEAVRHVLRERGATVEDRVPVSSRVPCTPGEPCAIVADGSIHATLPSDVASPVLVIDNQPAAPNVRVLSATTAAAHASAGGSARIAIEGKGLSGTHTTVRIRDGNVTLGSMRHQWLSDGAVTVDVPWWPMSPGPRLLRVDVIAELAESSTADNAIDVAVRIDGERVPVLVFDTRPSWSSTFVRRALEDDARFVVEHRARIAPALAAATPAGRLDAATLNRVSLLIVGAPEGVSEAETAPIDRFVRVRGGTAILLPERQPSGAVLRLLAAEWSEQLVAEPQAIGPLRATEILRAVAAPMGSTVFGAHGDRPAIVLTPAGEGAVLVSGAMDAWRFREHDNGAFDRFWRSVAAEAAVASRPLHITFTDQPVLPGTRQRFQVRVRSMDAADTLDASAIARCGAASQPVSTDAAAQPVRLWPAGPPGWFTGEIAIGPAAICELEVSAGGLTSTSGIAVAARPAVSSSRTLETLERAVLQAGGTVTHGDNLEPIRALNSGLPAARETVPLHPMRSTWWLAPFVACLSAEWWLRRRFGLR